MGIRGADFLHGMEGGTTGPDDDIAAESLRDIGAEIMGRHKFGGRDGPWGENPWNGWWGEGGTTFHFVTEGIHAALERAKDAAYGKDITLGGGANVAQQYLKGWPD
ncbi:MAG: hypothetical protein ACREX9_21690 [Gammaproteobacteria bacterium]